MGVSEKFLFHIFKRTFQTDKKVFRLLKSPQYRMHFTVLQNTVGSWKLQIYFVFLFSQNIFTFVLELHENRHEFNKEMYLQNCTHVFSFSVVIVWWNERRFRKSRKAFYWVFLQRRKSFSIPKPICF